MQEHYSKKAAIKDGEMKSLFGQSRSRFKSLYKREWTYFLKTPSFSFNGFVNVLVFPILVLISIGAKNNPPIFRIIRHD